MLMTRDAEGPEKKCDRSRRRLWPRWLELRVVVALLLLFALAAWRYGWPARSWETTVCPLEELGWQEAARLVDELDVKAVAGGLIGWARHLAAKAMKEKDYALVWRIERELITDLQGLGYLPKAVEQHEVRIGTFVDLARLAVEKDGKEGLVEPPSRGKLPPASGDGDAAPATLPASGESKRADGE